MATKRDLEREMRKLLASGKHEDRKKAKDVLAQMGRNAKALKAEATKQQTSLF